MIRRSTTYGPMLPQGVLEDDGADRGIMFVGLQAHLDRQFEFVKTEWINDGTFFGSPGREGPAGRAATTGRRVHHPPAADPPPPHRAARLRRQSRRRVLLHARPAGAALARRSRHLSPPTRNIDTRKPRHGRPTCPARGPGDPASDITDDFTFPSRSDQAAWCWS